MPTWPTSSKPATTTTDNDSDSISGARGDINQAITNVNTITDFFDLGTPGSGDNNKFLQYDSTSDTISLVTVSPGSGIAAVVDDTSPQLGGDLEVNDKSIINSAGSNRGDTFTLGGATTVNTGTGTVISGLPSGLDALGNSNKRLCGPIEIAVLDDLNSSNDRVHSLAKLTKITLTGDFTNTGKSRIRNNYVELAMDTDGNDFGPTVDRFGDGLIGQFITSKIFNSGSSSSTARSLTALLAAPQMDGNTSAMTTTNMRGMFVQPFLDSNATATNLFGFIYKDDNIDASATVTNHFSFHSDSTTATLRNDGPAILKGLTYPTSDGSANQVIKTDGAGNLSFTTVASGTGFAGGSAHDIGTIAATASSVSIDYSNGAIQTVNLTAATGTGSTVLNEPTNMSDGNILKLIISCTAGTVGQSADLVFATGGNYITDSSRVQPQQGNNKVVYTIQKLGSSFLAFQESVCIPR